MAGTFRHGAGTQSAGGAETQKRLAQAIALHRQGELEAAAAGYEEILASTPRCADAAHLLGHITKTRGDVSQAIELYQRAIALQPTQGEFHYSLGVAYQEAGQLEHAAASYRASLQNSAGHTAAQENLALVLAAQGARVEAEALLEQVAAAQPQRAQPLANLAEIVRQRGDLPRAAAIARRAVELDPSHATAHYNLAVILSKQGDADEALSHMRCVRDLTPENRAAHSSFLQLLHYVPGVSAEEMYSEHRRWNQQHCKQPADSRPRHANHRHTRLRIGYVSPDFRTHAVAHFLEPILQQHDRTQFALYAYADVGRGDAVTERMKTYFEAWCDIHRMSAAQVADQVARDEIDILIDLAGHTNGNRLDVFALKPAPVQVSYLGYPDTTGLDTMDYRISDAIADPPGARDRLTTETLVRLEPPFLCYPGPVYAPEVAPLPALSNGLITFGSLNNLLKVSDPIVREWAAILRAVPKSRLVLKTLVDREGEGEQRLRRLFEREGIEPARLVIHGFVADSRAFLDLYNGIDIALDTFPYHGTTTTCDALWMGVPVVTLAGETHASRVGATLLNSVGLSPLIATTAADYRNIAVDLAHDLPRLRSLRAQLRGQMAASPLADAKAFTARLESAFQTMWHTWCMAHGASQPLASPTQRSQVMPKSPNLTHPVVCTPLPDGVEVCVPDSLEDLTSYVLREQGDWLEPELAFIRRFLQPGMGVADWGAGYGIYTLTAARHVGDEGLVVAREDEGQRAQCLDRAARLNGFSNIRRVPLEVPTLAAQQPDFAAARPAPIGLLRIDAQIDALTCLAGNEELLRTQSPLVMIYSGEDTASTKQVAEYLGVFGYALYALIPGLQQLVPFEASLADPYRLNVFFCKSDRATELKGRGLLGRWLQGATDAPSAWPTGQWLEALGAEPYAAGFVGLWRNAADRAVNDPGLALHLEALDLHGAAHAAGTADDLRFGLLTESLSKISEAAANTATSARLQTLARICAELGLRQHAVRALEAITQHFMSDVQIQLDEPFLAVSASAAAADSGASPGAWCLQSVLEQRENLRHFSSYFATADDVAFLGEIADIGLATPSLEHRRAMLQRRAGQPTTPSAPALTARR